MLKLFVLLNRKFLGSKANPFHVTTAIKPTNKLRVINLFVRR